jgi:membrane protein DedA with SNARE-associated domain/pimeloyl-ACP methyl ester carboxylesterase
MRFVPSRRLLLFAAYAVALLASHVVRWPQGHAARPLPGQQVAVLTEAGRGAAPGRAVQMAYLDLRPAERPDAPVVVVLHGSPAQSMDVAAFARHLAVSNRVLLPDLPGFGRSTRKLPDYSMAAHAQYLRQWLDQLQIARAHVVGYSLGGGPALELYALEPDRIASLVLLSSIGVQEHELLGDYTLNHGLHGLQLGGLWMLAELVPHFGGLDDVMLNVAYARNYYDSDQRSLRGILERFQPPLLILHGQDDLLVPSAAAREHHRLVPQSELVMRPGGHILVYREAPALARQVADFVDRVERGAAATRASAPAERVAEAARPYAAIEQVPAVGLPLVILVALIALGTLVSEDLACIGAGLLVAHGMMTYPWAAFAAFLGIFVGDILLFLAGRYIGRPALRRAPFRWFVRETAIQDSTEWFARKGPVVILSSRFVPGSRLPTYFAAGLLHLNLATFMLWFLVAGAVWAPLLVWLSSLVGEPILAWLERYRAYTLAAVAAAAALLWLLIKLIVPLFTYRGRRLLVSRWIRITHWEFWPPWLFYPPLIAFLAWLSIRHRGAAVFTACNPAIPAGGFIGESKSAILDGLRGAAPWVAPHLLVPGGIGVEEKLARVRAFQADRAVGWPLVAKPDVGQRGLGVAIARTETDLAAYFRTPRPDTVVQAFVPGHEFGVFYYRYPGAERGRVFAITDKRFPQVTGDGRRSLERLILADPRAVCMARLHLHTQRDRLSWVPPAGERVTLVEVGTHCRGALFLDGTHLLTPALETRIDAVSRAFAGFHFGRYDLRAASVEAFQRGEGFQVIELNGVTAEATSIYQPGYSVFRAWGTLMRQWRIAYEIGAAQRAAGVQPLTLRALVELIARYRPAPEAR